MGLALVAGINLYATIITIGLGLRYDFIHLPPHLDALSILAHPYVLFAALFAYALEFFADKIPWMDSVWDSIHTFIRPIGAAILGVKAFGSVDPVIEITIFLICGGIGFSTHSTKAGFRLISNHSPEPFSNTLLSLLEDVTAFVGAWLAVTHPIAIFSISIVFMLLFIYLSPKLFRLFRLEFLAVVALCRSFLPNFQKQTSATMFDNLPDKYGKLFTSSDAVKPTNFCIRCFSGKGLSVGRNYMGFLCKLDNRLFFLTRKCFQVQKTDIDISTITAIDINKKFLFDCLSLRLSDKEIKVNYLKTKTLDSKQLSELIGIQRIQ